MDVHLNRPGPLPKGKPGPHGQQTGYIRQRTKNPSLDDSLGIDVKRLDGQRKPGHPVGGIHKFHLQVTEKGRTFQYFFQEFLVNRQQGFSFHT
jgi:hypothetical protein